MNAFFSFFVHIGSKHYLRAIACIYCSHWGEGPVCTQCAPSLIIRRGMCCDCCGHRLVSEHARCSRCRTQEDEHEEMVPMMHSLWTYNDFSHHLIKCYKQKGMRILGYYMAAQYVDYVQSKYRDESVCIIPMPSNKAHSVAMGFDHMSTFSFFIRLWGAYPTYFCIGRKYSREQKSLNVKERIHNMRESIYLKSRNTHLPTTLSQYDRIILCDDIITSGSTIQAAYKVLVSSMPTLAQKIVAMSLIRTEY